LLGAFLGTTFSCVHCVNLRSIRPTNTASEGTGRRTGASARHRFAIGGLALALAAAFGAPAVAHALSYSLKIPLEPTLVAVSFVVSFVFIGAGWALGRRVDKLAEEARRDPVTRVGNRRQWEESIEEEVERARSAKMPLSLMMVDVDNLKKLNDAAGHHAGDIALGVVGDVLNDTCRSRDVASRFGGDEFALLLPRTKASEAMVVAERIRSELARRRIDLAAPLDTLLSVSIGVCDLASAPLATPEGILEAADRALYAAKEAGRDRVEMFRKVEETSGVIDLDERRRTRRKLATTPGR